MIHEQFADLLRTDKPDERQIMTYVSCFYHAFQGAMQVNDIAWKKNMITHYLLVDFCLKITLWPQCGKTRNLLSHEKNRGNRLQCNLARNALMSRNFCEKYGESKFPQFFTLWIASETRLLTSTDETSFLLCLLIISRCFSCSTSFGWCLVFCIHI